MESWLSLREKERLTLRELSERSGIPVGTLATWTRNRRLSGVPCDNDGFLEMRVPNSGSIVLDPESASVLLRFSRGGVIELRGSLAETIAAKVVERLTQWC